MNEPLPPLKIVCFGDSLTLGYLSPTPDLPFPENIPYGTYLQEWLGPRGQIMVRGVCGETTQDMRVRFQTDVLELLPQLVIIVGGTNDLGWGISPSAILENLYFFYTQSQAHGIFPVAVTLPSLREDGWGIDGQEKVPPISDIPPAIAEAIAKRVILNQAIRDFGKEHHFPVVDWFTATCEPATKALTVEYSNDGLHLTTEGYRKLAEMIWTQVLEDLLTKKTAF